MFRFIAAACAAGQRKVGVDLGPEVIKAYVAKKKLDIPSSNVHFSIYKNHCDGYQRIFKLHNHFLKRDIHPITLGGDHSVSMASGASSLKEYGNLVKFVWVDAHADINTPETSLSGNTHGMPVSSLMKLSNLFRGTYPKLKPQNLVYIGLKDVDIKEKIMLRQLKIQAFWAEDLDKYDISEILEKINIHSSQKVHLSIDIDAIDPKYVPSTGTPVPYGLNPFEVYQIVNYFKEKIIATDIVEFNPLIGTDQCVESTNDIIYNIIKRL